MALVFGATGDRVDHGSGAGLDDLGAGAFTVWAWVYRTADGGNQHIVAKDGAFPSGWGFIADEYTTGNPGQIRFVVFRVDGTGTNWTDFASGTGATDKIALNEWTFVAATYDTAAATRASLYRGTLTAPAAETTYAIAQNGAAGAALADAAYNLYVGNLQRATGFPFKGRIARGGIVARRLTLAEVQRLQYATLAQAAAEPHRLLFDYADAASQGDYSGNGNAGTVTGATIADGPGLPRAAAPLWLPYAATTPVETTRLVRHNVRAAVSGSRTLTFTTRAALAVARQESHAVRSGVAGSRTLSYAVRAAVATARQERHDIRAIVAASRVVRHDTRAAVATSRQEAHAVRVALATGRAASYGVRAGVAAARVVRYNVGGIAALPLVALVANARPLGLTATARPTRLVAVARQ